MKADLVDAIERTLRTIRERDGEKCISGKLPAICLKPSRSKSHTMRDQGIEPRTGSRRDPQGVPIMLPGVGATPPASRLSLNVRIAVIHRELVA